MDWLLNLRQMNLLLKFISNDSKIITGDVLSSILFTNSKTIKNDIDTINTILNFNFGCQIISTPGVGYELIVTDNTDFNRFKQTLNSKFNHYFFTPINLPNYRVKFIIYNLLLTNDYLKIGDIAERLFVSRSTLTKELNTVKMILSDYHLQLSSAPYYGIKITGNEIHKRLLLIEFLCIDEDSNNLESESIYKNMIDDKKLSMILEEELRNLNLSISKSSFEKIAKLINISVYRYSLGFSIDKYIYRKKISVNKLACNFIERVFKRLEIKISEIESYVLSIFVNSRIENINQMPIEIRRNNKVYKIAQDILNWIYDVANYYFESSEKLILDLAKHIQTMMIRSEYGFEKQNINMDYARDNHKSYEIAYLIAEYFHCKKGIEISENEIAYLSYLTEKHFQEPIRTLNIQVVMHNGGVIGDYVIDQIRNNFDNVGLIDSELYYNLSEEDEKIYDCIITDIPRNEFDSLRTVINITNSELKEVDILELNKVFVNHAHKKKEFLYSIRGYFLIGDKVNNFNSLIDKILEIISKDSIIPDDFKEMILKREKNSYSINSNGVLFLSTLYMASVLPQTYIFKAEKPIFHKGQYASLIVLVSNGVGETMPYGALNKAKEIFRNPNTVYSVYNADNLSEVLNILEVVD